MGKDGLPLVTEEARDSPWWLPLLGIAVIAMAFGWLALSLSDEGDEPTTVTVEILPADGQEATEE